jgi:transglutaminase superfamily protein
MIARVSKVAALNAGDVRLMGRAFFTLVCVRVSLWIKPWRRMRASIDGPVDVSRPDVGRLAWAVRAASRAVPRATCLTQALALQRLLSHFGYPAVVQVGIQNVDGEFAAHAWVEHCGRPLLGAAADLSPYTRFFVWPESRPHLP